MSITISTVATGVKVVGGAIVGWSTNEFVESVAEVVFKQSAKKILKSRAARKMLIKCTGATAGVIAATCWDTKVDDATIFATAVAKTIKGVKEELQKRELQKKEGTKAEKA